VTLLVVIPRTYTAEAKIFIGTQKAPFIQQQSLFAETPIDNAQMEWLFGQQLTGVAPQTDSLERPAAAQVRGDLAR